MIRSAIAGIVIAYALAVIETTLGSRLAVAGAAPDLLLVWTVCAGLLGGPRVGMVIGFAAGATEGALLQSLIGPLAIGKGASGFAAGAISTKLSREHCLTPAIAAALLTVINDVAFIALAGAQGSWLFSARTIGLRALYHALLTPFAYAAASRARRAITGAGVEIA